MIILAIRSVTDVLRDQTRFVNLWGVRPKAKPLHILQAYSGSDASYDRITI